MIDTLSRQRHWQLERMAAGLFQSCGELPRDVCEGEDQVYCTACRERLNTARNARAARGRIQKLKKPF